MTRRASPPPARHLFVLPVLALFAVSHVHATIFVPEEIPSLLSVIYSNLPPIKKGTDSRLGVGFRLGPNADVQFQLELGPQTNTLPIGGTAGGGGATNLAQKRHAVVVQGGSGKPRDWLNAWRLQMSPGYVPADGGGGGDEDGRTGVVSKAASDDGAENPVAQHLRQLYKPLPVVAR